ncbi:MAG: RNA polymerase sigma factor [Chitinophagaceae bacterium]|nr:RNA polymerase sigma factor [Chitinophagaceae bacterium]
MTEKEYNHCIREHADGVYRFILKNLRHAEDARDVVQSAFEKMWAVRDTVDGNRCKSFLFTVAYHQMIDHIRKRKFTVNEDMAEEMPVYNTQQRQTKKIIDGALARLNETQRSLVLLKDYEGYSYEEIGEITGLSSSQVKVYLHRARIQLKNYLVRPENILEQ